ncbi:MAG: two-component sensor histidine kinase [Ferruginibacter sp.]|nr:two-component sensor histidine kinase [Ferruginibacter sp.]
MKLLAKYNRLTIFSAIIALLISSICYYFFIRYELILQLDRDLEIEELEIRDYVKLHDRLPNATSYKDQLISFAPATGEPVKRKFSSREVFSNTDNEWQPIREIVFPMQVNGQYYKIMISKSQRETNELIQLILLITSSIAIALLLVLFIINRFLFNKLWQPFNATLYQLKQFNLAGKKQLQLQETGIHEFAELNNAVTAMSSRVSLDYEALKSFTENASHEIQTPLAIIQTKIELLMQSDQLQEEQVRHIQSMQDACSRLSKLNQSLILLTKIDNQQFQEKDIINAGNILRHQLKNYEELVAAKKITVTTSIDNECTIAMNETMAEILFSNLVTNAIKHNLANGKIDIVLTPNNLVISNTGHPLKVNPAELFERFKKDDQDTISLGLGLSIVKKICEQNRFLATYNCNGEMHTIQVQF